jgi:tetratricopeptide (TPR) repeat protein
MAVTSHPIPPASPDAGNAPDTAARLSPAQASHLIVRRLETVLAGEPLALADVRRLALRHTYRPGQVILPRRARADSLGLVVAGQVAVYGRTVPLDRAGADPQEQRPDAVLRPGCTFGEAMLAHNGPNDALLQALTPCEVWFLRRVDLAAALERSAQRQASRRVAAIRRLGLPLVAGLAVVLCLVALVLPAARKVLAVGPMAVGQWCQQGSHAGCAHAAWTLAAGLAPSDVNPRLALGNLYYRRGNVATAEQTFKAAQALAPEVPEIYNNLGVIYAGQGAHDLAAAAFERAVALEPGNPIAESNLAFSLQALGRNEEALAHYQTALALGDRQASTPANMAIAYYETGQMARAADAARQALAAGGKQSPAYAVLGAVALDSDQPEAALPPLVQALILDPGYSPAYFFLGLAYKALDRPVEALAALEQALIVAPDEATRLQVRRHLAELSGEPSP